MVWWLIRCLKEELDKEDRKILYNVLTQTFVQGKCTYKKRISDLGVDEIVEHSDAPLLAPEIFIFNGDIQYNFKKVMILDNSDLDILIKNLIEIKNFIGRYNEMKKINTDIELMDELIKIIREYDSSKGDKNMSVDQMRDLINSHEFKSDFAHNCALDTLKDYQRMRSDLG